MEPTARAKNAADPGPQRLSPLPAPDREVRRRSGRIQRWIIVAFVALGLIGAITQLFIYFEFAHEAPQATDTVSQGGRAAQAIDAIADDVGEVRRLLTLEVTRLEFGATPEETAQTIRRIEMQIAALGRAVASNTTPSLQPLVPMLTRFQESSTEAIAAIRRDDLTQAATLLEVEVDPLAHELRPHLDTIAEQAREDAASGLSALRGDLVRMQSAYVLLGLSFAASLAVAAVLTVRELRRREAALAAYIERIEQANRDLDAFAGRIAHDVRSPLSALPIVARLLTTHAHDPEQVRSLAERIVRSTDKTDALVRSLLAFSRSGQVSLGEERCRGDRVVSNLLEGLEAEASAAQIELSCEVVPAEVTVAEPLVEQILDNLLRNAIRYMGASERRHIHVRMTEGRGHIRFAVADTGPGVPREGRERLFEPFHRLHRRADGGIGLGLATVKRLVEAYGGRVYVEDNRGGGAVFWFTLPSAPARLKREEEAAPPLH